MSDVRIVALHQHERAAVRAKLVEAIERGEDNEDVLLTVAEMLLRAKRADEFGGLNDA